MRLSELTEGQRFQFRDGAIDGRPARTWIARGQGWYSWPYDGGPWHLDDDPEVIPIAHRGRAAMTPADWTDAGRASFNRHMDGRENVTAIHRHGNQLYLVYDDDDDVGVMDTKTGYWRFISRTEAVQLGAIPEVIT